MSVLGKVKVSLQAAVLAIFRYRKGLSCPGSGATSRQARLLVIWLIRVASWLAFSRESDTSSVWWSSPACFFVQHVRFYHLSTLAFWPAFGRVLRGCRLAAFARNWPLERS